MKKISYGFAASHKEEEVVSDSYLLINNCGLMAVGSVGEKPIIGERPPRKDYMLVYFTKEGGYFELEKNICELNQGDLVYIEPGVPINFGVKKNSQHYWIHFTGENVSEIMLSAGISKTGIYNVGYSKSILNKFNDISFYLFPRSPTSILRCNGIFLQLLSHTAKRLHKASNNDYNNNNIEQHEKITPALKYINNYYFENNPLTFYADLCNISLSSFKHLFTEVTKVPPLTYINTLRIENAKRYLTTTQMNISEIANAVGFEDSLYFSKVFKKYSGMSPSSFRK